MQLPPKRKRVQDIKYPNGYKPKKRVGYKRGDSSKTKEPRTPLRTRRNALSNLLTALECGARGFVLKYGYYYARLNIQGKKIVLGKFECPFTAKRVYQIATQKRIYQLRKEIAYLEKFSVEELMSIGKIPLVNPEDSEELLVQMDRFFEKYHSSRSIVKE